MGECCAAHNDASSALRSAILISENGQITGGISNLRRKYFLIKTRNVARNTKGAENYRRVHEKRMTKRTAAHFRLINSIEWNWRRIAHETSSRLSTFLIGNSIFPRIWMHKLSRKCIQRITHVYIWFSIRIVFTLIACSSLAQHNFRLSTSDNYYD